MLNQRDLMGWRMNSVTGPSFKERWCSTDRCVCEKTGKLMRQADAASRSKSSPALFIKHFSKCNVIVSCTFSLVLTCIHNVFSFYQCLQHVKMYKISQMVEYI